MHTTRSWYTSQQNVCLHLMHTEDMPGLKDMERIRPTCIMDIIYSGETMSVKEQVSLPSQRICSRCNFVSSQEVCKACVLLEGLNKGLPKLGIGKTSKAKKMLEEYNARQMQENPLKQAIKDLEDTSISIKDNIQDASNKCNSKNCCSGKCNSDASKQQNGNAKINKLLEQYGLNDSPSSQKVNGDVSDDECSGGCGKSSSMLVGF